jgi:hypothetical protein
MAMPALYKNCTALNAKYPHGVGRLTAEGQKTGTPVRTFKRSTVLYNKAMSFNKRLDRLREEVGLWRPELVQLERPISNSTACVGGNPWRGIAAVARVTCPSFVEGHRCLAVTSVPEPVRSAPGGADRCFDF